MAKKIWTKNGRIVTRNGRALFCEECPCKEPCNGCAAGTSKAQYAITFPNVIVNGTCLNCATFSGATFIVSRDIPTLGLCGWRILIFDVCTDSPFSDTITLSIIYNSFTDTTLIAIQLFLSGGSTNIFWRRTVDGLADCDFDNFSVPWDATLGATRCSLTANDPVVISAV